MTTIKPGLIMATVLFMTIPTIAQTEKEEYYDIRMKKALDAEEIEYSITKNNNFKIEMLTEDKPVSRSQMVFITSKTQTYSDFEIREISSVSAIMKKSQLRDTLMFNLLLKNWTLKIGCWEIKQYDGEDDVYISFCVKVGANVDPKYLSGLIYLVASEADKLEKLIGRKDEY